MRQPAGALTKGKVTKEWRYYLSSLVLSAAEFNQRIRAHWAIENQCHWVLDVGMREDACRVRCDHGAENLGVLRRIALNLVSLEHSVNSSMKSKAPCGLAFRLPAGSAGPLD